MGDILCAYDGSETAKKAVEHGANLLTEDDELIIIYVVPSVHMREFAGIDPVTSLAKAKELVDELVKELRNRNVNARGLAREGDIADEILKLSEDLECDLIVVGHKGRNLGKIGRFQLGSVADKVARHAKRPVLIVR